MAIPIVLHMMSLLAGTVAIFLFVVTACAAVRWLDLEYVDLRGPFKFGLMVKAREGGYSVPRVPRPIDSSKDKHMSLLDQGTDDVVLYPQEVTTDQDGNTMTRPSAIGVPCRAVVELLGQPSENQDGGFPSSSKSRLRLVGYPDELGPESQIEWRGERWSLAGPAIRYNGSPRLRRLEYVIVRH